MSKNGIQKVILITGTSSGFGLFLAARLAAAGHCVYATMRDLNKKQALLDEVARRQAQVFARELDVTKPASITTVMNEIKQRHGHIEVLINNAGCGLGGFFEDLLEEEIRAQMEVNFFGVQNVCRQVVPLMREKQRGLIINISSISGQTASPCLGAYAASKWALEGFSESLYYELSNFGVKVVLVEPGAYPTKIFKENARYGKNYDNPQSPYYHFSQRLREFVRTYVHSSKKDPEDVAKLVERIIAARNPKLRYISDFPSWVRVMVGKLMPPSWYAFIFNKLVLTRILQHKIRP